MAVRKAKAVKKTRTNARHNAQNVGIGGFLLFALGRIETLTATEALWIYGGSMVLLSGLWKIVDDSKLIPRLMKKIGAASIVVLLATGCAGLVGTSTPIELTGSDGDPVIAHTIQGVAWSFWDAGIGANVEGGSGGDTTVDLLTAVVETAGRIVAGFFTGLGGIGSSLTEATAAADDPSSGAL